MKEFIFQIDNLCCAYSDKNNKQGKIVLKIEHLNIPKGEIVFFVGPSGIGKSTILETLGLMNNTIQSVEKFLYRGDKEFDLRNAWQWKDDMLSDFRCSEYSFIFQQTNLMPNFSAYENIMATALLQNMEFDKARKRTNEVLQKMELPTEDRPIFEYSGGQQQRLAFARAIMPDFNVLFGDEPTGNLDPTSADNLMSVLSNAIQDKKATAIIVSHDMHLASMYADEIVRINRVSQGEDSYGLINKKSIYIRTDEQTWLHGTTQYSPKELQTKLSEEQ